MPSTDRSSGKLSEPLPGEMRDYQAISPLAIASAVVGAASVTAMIGVPLWSVPLLGILLSWLSLVLINRAGGAVVGRPLALAGLSLSVCFGVAAVAGHFNSQRLVARQAGQAAAEWFAALARHQPELAHQWTVAYGQRSGAYDPVQLRAYYQINPKQSEKLAEFVAASPVNLLLALGPRAHVRLESTIAIDDHLEYISQTYEVTYQDAGKPQRFSMALTFNRNTVPGLTHHWWRLMEWPTIGPPPPMPAE
jgi:hypothetical protein